MATEQKVREETTSEDIQRHRYTLQCIGQGERIDEGKVLTHDQVENAPAKWLK